jgi:hypothetical protein
MKECYMDDKFVLMSLYLYRVRHSSHFVHFNLYLPHLSFKAARFLGEYMKAYQDTLSETTTEWTPPDT